MAERRLFSRFLLSTYRIEDRVVIQCESIPQAEEALSRVMAWLYSQVEMPGDVCPQCGGNAPWIPVAGEQLIEVETGEPCHIEWTAGHSAHVKWDSPSCSYGTYTFKQMREGFERRVSENQTAAPHMLREGWFRLGPDGQWHPVQPFMLAGDEDEARTVQMCFPGQSVEFRGGGDG